VQCLQREETIETQQKKAKISALLQSTQINQYMNFTAVVTEFNATLQTTKSGNTMRKITVADDSASINIIALKDAVDDVFDVGQVVNVNGKLGDNNSLLIFQPMKATEDQDLQNIWENNSCVKEESSSKRMRPNAMKMTLDKLNEDCIGKDVELTVVVVSYDTQSTTTQNGKTKKNMVVVDQSCFAIELTIFGDWNQEIEFGSVFSLTATVSEWNCLSNYQSFQLSFEN
jgi:hypothetical protein